MCSSKRLLLVTLALCMTPGVTYSQSSGVTQATVTVLDGALTLQGAFREVSGIEASSVGGHLGLQTQEIPGVGSVEMTAPFSDGLVVASRPDTVVLGVLGAANRVSFSGTTKTSILYSETPETAASDLTLSLAAGNCVEPLSIGVTDPATWTCVGRNWQPGGEGGGEVQVVVDPVFKLVDGEIYIEGDFENLTSIEVISPKGNLGLGEVDSGVIDYTPFTGQATAFVNGDSVVLGALGASFRVDISGVTKTAIQYSETLEFAQTDLTVQIGLGDSGPQSLTVAPAELLTDRGATIQDGFITLVGSFNQLAGIEAVSVGDFAFMEELQATGTKLFPVLDSDILESSETRIAIRTDARVNLDGLIPTGIFFTGSAQAFAESGVQLLVGLGAETPVSLPNVTETVPEPSSVYLGMLGVLGLLLIRRRRNSL